MTESPAYLLESKEDNFEIRRYPDYLLAQVDVEADFDGAIGIGFSILANYIFGANKKRSSIPMTTPVSMEKIPGSEKIPMAAPVTQEVPSERINMLADKAKMILAVEMSAGQMVEDVMLAVNGKTPVHFYGRMGGMVPTPDEVVDFLNNLISGS